MKDKRKRNIDPRLTLVWQQLLLTNERGRLSGPGRSLQVHLLRPVFEALTNASPIAFTLGMAGPKLEDQHGWTWSLSILRL